MRYDVDQEVLGEAITLAKKIADLPLAAIVFAVDVLANTMLARDCAEDRAEEQTFARALKEVALKGFTR
jgi:hypothetical protein